MRQTNVLVSQRATRNINVEMEQRSTIGQRIADRVASLALDIGWYERTLRAQGFRRVAGVDEAGRGALAGPLVAANASQRNRLASGGRGAAWVMRVACGWNFPVGLCQPA